MNSYESCATESLSHQSLGEMKRICIKIAVYHQVVHVLASTQVAIGKKGKKITYESHKYDEPISMGFSCILPAFNPSNTHQPICQTNIKTKLALAEGFSMSLPPSVEENLHFYFRSIFSCVACYPLEYSEWSFSKISQRFLFMESGRSGSLEHGKTGDKRPTQNRSLI